METAKLNFGISELFIKIKELYSFQVENETIVLKMLKVKFHSCS